MKTRTILLSGVAVFLLAGPAAAQTQGWYLGLGAGWNNPSNIDFNAGPGVHGSVQMKDSAAYIATIGYKWRNGIRLELEPGYADPDVGSGLKGDVQQTTLFANLAYDIPLARWVSLTLGAGAGMGWVDPSIKTTPPSIRVANGSDTAFAWQALAGLTFPLSDNFELQADYRYRSIGDTTHSSAFFAPTNISAKDKNSQVVMVSLRWYLHGAEEPPPPPPPPAMAPAVKTFIVFFDFDKSNLTNEAQTVVAEAVNTAKKTGMVRVLVTGHTDTVGSRAYNQGLSERRANSVKAEMIRLGMSEGEITTVGKNFSEPLVPTGPGVREPQNRRAVIDLGGGSQS